jgi:LEA14-like dessication related protein
VGKNVTEFAGGGGDMPEGLLGEIVGDADEKPEVQAPEALAGAEAFAAAVAAIASRQDPEVARKTAVFLDHQSRPVETRRRHLEDEHVPRLSNLRYQSQLLRALPVLLALGMPPIGGCASYQSREPIQVIMVGVDPLQGEGLELRMLVKLRIQNPNDSPLDFNGLFVQMDVQGKSFATGVSDVGGTVARYGETIVAVPVSISVFRIARQAIGVMTNEYRGKLAYEIRGKLAGPAFNSVHFRSKGEFTLPSDIAGGDK